MASYKVALITGCSSGVGLSLATQLAKSTAPHLYRVYATMRNLDKKQGLEKEAGDTLNKSLFIHKLDVCDPSSVKSAVDHIVSKEGRLDILVNNAGQGLSGPLEAQTPEQIEACFKTNFYGVLYCTNEVMRVMKKQRSGHILHVTSVGGVSGVPFNDVYCAAKFAVEGLAESQAALLKLFNIRTTLIEPGAIMTDFVANANGGDKPDIDTLPLDDLTKAAFKTYFASMMSRFTPAMAQTGEQVAKVIKDEIENPQGHFRVLTNPAYKERIAAKLTDPTGDAPLKATLEAFFSPLLQKQ